MVILGLLRRSEENHGYHVDSSWLLVLRETVSEYFKRNASRAIGQLRSERGPAPLGNVGRLKTEAKFSPLSFGPIVRNYPDLQY